MTNAVGRPIAPLVLSADEWSRSKGPLLVSRGIVNERSVFGDDPVK